MKQECIFSLFLKRDAQYKGRSVEKYIAVIYITLDISSYDRTYCMDMCSYNSEAVLHLIPAIYTCVMILCEELFITAKCVSQ